MAGYRALKSVQRRFWELVAEGVTPTVAGAMGGVAERCGQDWFRHFGGVKPQFIDHKGTRRPRLSIAEREEIMIGTARGESIRSIAHRLERAASTIMHEINNNGRCREAAGRHTGLQRVGAHTGGRE